MTRGLESRLSVVKMQGPDESQPNDEVCPTGPELNQAERRAVDERHAPTAIVIHEVIRRFGEDELCRAPQGLAWSGLAAGLSMGFSLVGRGLLLAFLPPGPWSPLVYDWGYTLGFLIVTLGRQELFTETTITAVLPLLVRPSRVRLLRVARLWGIVLATNIIGTLIFAWVLSHTEVFGPHVRAAFAVLGYDTLSGSFAEVVIRAIFAGWLIALMIWLLPSAEPERIGIILIITYAIALGGLDHVIAGSVDVLYVVTSGGATYGRYLLGFLLPSLIGNAIGGVALVSALNYAQVYAGRPRQ